MTGFDVSVESGLAALDTDKRILTFLIVYHNPIIKPLSTLLRVCVTTGQLSRFRVTVSATAKGLFETCCNQNDNTGGPVNLITLIPRTRLNGNAREHLLLNG